MYVCTYECGIELWFNMETIDGLHYYTGYVASEMLVMIYRQYLTLGTHVQ